MNKFPRNVFMLTLTIALCFFFLFLTPTYAQRLPTLELAPKPAPQSNLTSSNTKSTPQSNSTSSVTKPKPESNSASSNTKPTPKSSSTSSNTKPTPKSNSTSSNTKPTPKSNSTSSNTKTNATSPYHFANHFCLFRRLDVKSTFCLQVLRSGPASTKAKDKQALLDIAADLAIQFGNKTILFLKKLSNDKKTKPDLKPVIEECLSAYEGYLTQYKVLVQEAKTEAQLASYDSELAKLEINRCVKALSKTKNADIESQNKVALDYTKLSQNIADSID